MEGLHPTGTPVSFIATELIFGVTMKYRFFDRDISWLSFNGRVLAEAQRETVPLMERFRFLSIFSSNLDEFYRVRMPALLALSRLSEKGKNTSGARTLSKVNSIILGQQVKFGKILTRELLPLLESHGTRLLFNQPLSEGMKKITEEYFFQEVAAFIHWTELTEKTNHFPENNKLYLVATVRDRQDQVRYFLLNVPSDQLPRFFSVTFDGIPTIVFLDDVIRANMHNIFRDYTCLSCKSFKVTRDAELDLKDEFEGNLARKIEREISRRDLGLATRFLYDSSMGKHTLGLLSERLGLKMATFVKGGTYHNLKDLASLPARDEVFFYGKWPAKKYPVNAGTPQLLDRLLEGDILLHLPFHSYDTVLRFFNEAAIDADVTRIYVTLYRIASDSRIASALINASRNGKKVTVFVELKARFDEANNIKWAKRMQQAGVNIIFSIPEMKVHAKVALVKRKKNHQTTYFGLLSTGNFNETTARFYTDHILMTSNHGMLKEAENLFKFLKERKKPSAANSPMFRNLLVAPFNLKERFGDLIDREIGLVRSGLQGSITIKMNNLEEESLISKLYKASQAGVSVSLIVRGICCLVPGVAGMSENIRVIRIVDRYLEHGRIFMFGNNGDPEIFMGSADWMNRNIYRRIEVCFPIYDARMKSELSRILNDQLRDTLQAVTIDRHSANIPVEPATGEGLQSQKTIYEYLAGQV